MATLKQAAESFLAHKRIAVAGVSSTKPDAANGIYLKLRELGYTVYAINPKVTEVEGDPCYPDLKSTPELAEAVVIATPPAATEQLVQQCADLGIHDVWMHRGMAALGSSVSEKAVEFCHEHQINVIDGGCPMMFAEPVDIAHKCFRWILGATGSLPKDVSMN